jgi:Uma2 family endonuclease
VTTDVDLRLADVPLLNRRPDVVVYWAGVPDDQVLRPQDVELVVEITSPGSVTQDTIDKPGEYAAAGVGHYYWRVAPEEATVYTYAMIPRSNAFQLTGEHKGRLIVDRPVSLDLELAGLLRR